MKRSNAGSGEDFQIKTRINVLIVHIAAKILLKMKDGALNRKFLIATHGAFAKGIQSSLDMIIGPTDQVFLLQAYLDGNQSIEADLQKVMNQVGPEDELIIFSDLLGGSVNNQLLRFALREHVHIISGFNLPLLIEIMLSDINMPIREIIKGAITGAREQMVYVNDLVSDRLKENEND